MSFIESLLLLSFFVSCKCDPETLLIETDGESESENNNNKETLPLSNPNLNEDGEENEEEGSNEIKSGIDYSQKKGQRSQKKGQKSQKSQKALCRRNPCSKKCKKKSKQWVCL